MKKISARMNNKIRSSKLKPIKSKSQQTNRKDYKENTKREKKIL